MAITNVTIAGAGTMGSQIAWQVAFGGYIVTVFDVYEKSLQVAQRAHRQYADLFMESYGASKQAVEETAARLHYTTDLVEAVKNADIVSESIPENLEIKQSFFSDLSEAAPAKTIFTTNTSTLVPCEIVAAVDRPKRFLALHFSNPVWGSNVAEVMGHPTTDPFVFSQIVEFARSIGMVPIPLNKEQPGYIMNSLLVPFLAAAGNLYVQGVTDHESIDTIWMISTRSKMGPFGMMDIANPIVPSRLLSWAR